MKTLNVVLVAPLEKPGFTGGQARAASILTRGLQARPDVELHNVVHPHKEETGTRLQGLWLRLRFYGDFLATLIRVRPAVIHFFVPCAFLSIVEKSLLAMVARLFGASTLFNPRNDPRTLLATLSVGRRRVLRTLFRQHTGVLCQFQALKTFYVDEFGLAPDRVFVVHNAIPEGGAAATAEDYARRFEGRRVLFLGSVEPRKGIDVVLRALGRCQDVRLDVVGDPQPHRYLQELETLADTLSVRERVRFHGPKFGDDKRALLDHAACLVLPSRAEGFPNVVLEAAQCGLPVIVTRTGAAEDINAALGDGARVIDVDADDQLAVELAELFRDADVYARRSQAARAGAGTFSVENMCDGFLAAYRATAFPGQETIE